MRTHATMIFKRWQRNSLTRYCVLASLALIAGVQIRPCQAADKKAQDGVNGFNYVLGTQSFGARYQFTGEDLLVESALAMREMGSNIIKFEMSKTYFGPHRNIPRENPAIHSLTDLARDEPSHKRVFNMPFVSYLIWAYPFSSGEWGGQLEKVESDNEYRELYEFSCYLLKTYNGTGKSFYLGHWEGDWYLHPGYKSESDPTPEAIQGMIDRLNIRQKAIEDAKHDVPHRGVEVFQYTEANLVQKAINGGKALASAVLPKTQVDFVSYSSYDSTMQTNIESALTTALDYLESKLPPKPRIHGKRVFIGEYGYPARDYSPQQQDEKARRVMRTALRWGCPFVLYWQLYNNEVDDKGHKGFWLIDEKGQKQPVYTTHQRFYTCARRFVADFQNLHHRLPTPEEFSRRAVSLLDPTPSPPSPTRPR